MKKVKFKKITITNSKRYDIGDEDVVESKLADALIKKCDAVDVALIEPIAKNKRRG